MMGINELADHILAVAKNKNKKISNLQLQKILFFMFGRCLQVGGNPIQYDMDFEKWRYGPVVPSIYYKYKHHGGMPIVISDDIEENENLKFLNGDIVNLIDRDPYELVEISHRLASWNDYAEKILNGDRVPPYTLDEFKSEFIGNV